MSREARRAAALIAELQQAEPARYALARYVSLAVRIDQPFLRATRLRLVPQASARDEAELWFGPLVQNFNASGFVLLPEVASQLRDTLRGDPALVSAIHGLLRQAHGHLAPVVQLEERLTAQALAGRPLANLERGFAAATRGLLNPRRSALARWVERAMPRFPPEVQGLPVAQFTQQRATLVNTIAGAAKMPPTANRDWRELVRLDPDRRVTVWLCHTGGSLQISLRPDERRYAQSVKVQHADPQLVAVEGREGRRLMRLTGAAPARVPVDGGALRISFADGQVFRIRPGERTGASPDRPVITVVCALADYDELVLVQKGLEPLLADQYWFEWPDPQTESGEAPAEWLQEKISRSDLVLAVIGDSWFRPRGKGDQAGREKEGGDRGGRDKGGHNKAGQDKAGHYESSGDEDGHGHALQQIELALKLDVPLVPVRVTESSLPAQPLPDALSFLSHLQVSSLGPGPGSEERLRRLAWQVRNGAGRLRTQNTLAPFRTFRDRLPGGASGPEMVVLPAGSFLMGSDPDQDPASQPWERPQHRVTIREPFAIGRYPVTFEEYDQFARETGMALPGNEDWGRGRRPVINVNWQEAGEYCRWLSERSGRIYRLPTDAEWEYAARAGTRTPFFWGTEQSAAGTYAWFAENSSGSSRPVGGKRDNPWGLYDMAGNVLEWVDDVWTEGYDAERESRASSAAEDSSGTLRVLRGGSWSYGPDLLRSADRLRLNPDNRNLNVGFRVVCRPH